MKLPLSGTKKGDVKAELITTIRGGLDLPNNRLPSERELATHFKVGRGTIRRAINELVEDGLVVRNHGSGTYIRSDLSKINITIFAPTVAQSNKISVKHIRQKLEDFSATSPQKVSLCQIIGETEDSPLDANKQIVKLFSLTEPVSYCTITVNELAWLAQMGFCEDLTDRFSTWKAADNLHEIALKAVNHKNRLYALPTHCSLGALQYHKTAFDQIGIDAHEMVQSLDEFRRAIKKFAQHDEYKYTFFCTPLRFLLMHLLRAFYQDLSSRFSWKNQTPIDREVCHEMLQIVHKLKWKLRAFIPGASEMTANAHWANFNQSYGQGFVPMGITGLAHERESIVTQDTDFIPLGFGAGKGQFTFYNSYAFIINPRQTQKARQFVWEFLSDYVSPQTDLELDRLYLQNGDINNRNNSFIHIPNRIPDQPNYEEMRRNLLKVAELEIPEPSPAFDPLVTVAQRILLDPQINSDQEYDFYRTLVYRELEANSNRIVS